jgi:hypothetical protein
VQEAMEGEGRYLLSKDGRTELKRGQRKKRKKMGAGDPCNV